jgi:MoxR-like ATPase
MGAMHSAQSLSQQQRELEAAAAAVRQVQERLARSFVARSETIRILLVAAIAHEHVLIVGPPGTAKSAMLRLFARLCDARYFEYLLTRFTEPNELFGPVDIGKFREGLYERRIEGMLPTAEIAFLDEIFKANSAILNSLLTLLNERRFSVGGHTMRSPLISLLGATNEVPNDEALAAIFDRFLLRVVSTNLDAFHFQTLLRVGWQSERELILGELEDEKPLLSSGHLRLLHRRLAAFQSFPPQFLSLYKDLVIRLRNEGVQISDRRVVKLLKVFATNALLDGRPQVDRSDLVLLRTIWNHRDQIDLIESVVEPELDAYYAEHPDVRRPGAAELDFEALVAELEKTAARLTGGESLPDVELFAHLRTLHDLKSAFQALGTEAASERLVYIDRLLEFVYQKGPSTPGPL